MLASKCRTKWHGWRRRRRQWREERTGWQLACQSGGRTASTSRRAKGKVKFCCVRKCDFFAIGWNQSLLPDDVPMQSPRSSTAHTRAMCVIWPLQDGVAAVPQNSRPLSGNRRTSEGRDRPQDAFCGGDKLMPAHCPVAVHFSALPGAFEQVAFGCASRMRARGKP